MSIDYDEPGCGCVYPDATTCEADHLSLIEDDVFDPPPDFEPCPCGCHYDGDEQGREMDQYYHWGRG